jgi:hypothetical protein
MDAFAEQITASVWKDGDSTSLVQISTSYSPISTVPAFGVGDPRGTVTFHEAWFSTTPIPLPPEIGGPTAFEIGFRDDFVVLANGFGGAGSYTDGDLDLDGEVQFSDFVLLANAFGTTSAAAAVPEPSTWSLLGISWLILGLARHSRSRVALSR